MDGGALSIGIEDHRMVQDILQTRQGSIQLLLATEGIVGRALILLQPVGGGHTDGQSRLVPGDVIGQLLPVLVGGGHRLDVLQLGMGGDFVSVHFSSFFVRLLVGDARLIP